MSNKTFYNVSISINEPDKLFPCCLIDNTIYEDWDETKKHEKLEITSLDDLIQYLDDLNSTPTVKSLYNDEGIYKKIDLDDDTFKLEIKSQLGGFFGPRTYNIFSDEFKSAEINMLISYDKIFRDKDAFGSFALANPKTFREFMNDHDLVDGKSINEYWEKMNKEIILEDLNAEYRHWDEIIAKVINKEENNE